VPEKKKSMLTGNTNICVQRGVAIETQAGKDIADKAGRGRLSKKEVMSWLGTSEYFTLAAVCFQSKDFMNITADQ